MSLSRLLEIVNLLLVNENLSAKYLADYFGVSTRTIYRDIDKLTLANIPIYSNQGKNGGFSLLEEYTINKQLISKEDQLNVINALNDLPLTSTKNSLNKLNALFNIEHREWIQIDFKPWYEMEETNIFQELKNAILNNYSILFDYIGSNGKVSQKKIYPYKIYFKSYGWYLVGYDIQKKDNRVYKITRMNNLKISDTFNYEIFKNINADKLFDSKAMRPIKKKKVVLRIGKVFGFRVYDEFKNDEIKEFDEYYEVSQMTPIDEWFKSYLLSFMCQIEIVEPVSLKKEMKELLEEMKNHI